MPKQIIFFICCWWMMMAACNGERAAPRSAAVPAKSSRHARLLSHFPNLSFDTLWVFSPGEFVTGSDDAMKGKPLDSMDASLFPAEIAEQHFQEPPGIFAIGKFAIDKRYTALIARTPAEYVPSSIKLFIYDSKRDVLGDYCELGQSIGDAGDVVLKNAWIFRNGKQLRAFLVATELHYHAAEDEQDTTVDRAYYPALLQFDNGRIDTLSTDSAALINQFRAQVTICRKQASDPN